MSDNLIEEKMKIAIESIIKEKMKENLNNTNAIDKKNVTKMILNELDKVMKDETNKD